MFIRNVYCYDILVSVLLIISFIIDLIVVIVVNIVVVVLWVGFLGNVVVISVRLVGDVMVDFIFWDNWVIINVVLF